MDHIHGIEQLRRDRYLPVNASLTLLQALNDDDLGGQIDAFGSQRQRFGYSATGIAHLFALGISTERYTITNSVTVALNLLRKAASLADPARLSFVAPAFAVWPKPLKLGYIGIVQTKAPALTKVFLKKIISISRRSRF